MRVEQVNEVGMWTVDDKVKAECLQEDLLGGEDLAGNFINFLREAKKVKRSISRAYYEKITKKTYWTTFRNVSNI